jgi:hypothetical protein
MCASSMHRVRQRLTAKIHLIMGIGNVLLNGHGADVPYRGGG